MEFAKVLRTGILALLFITVLIEPEVDDRLNMLAKLLELWLLFSGCCDEVFRLSFEVSECEELISNLLLPSLASDLLSVDRENSWKLLIMFTRPPQNFS